MTKKINRREFCLAASSVAAAAQAGPEWGNQVLDIHIHPRRGPATCFDHIQGSGVSRAVILARAADAERVKGEITAHPGSFIWFASADPTQPGNIDLLRRAVEANGARGFGEMKNPTAADSREMRMVYDMAADLGVPVLIHFQEVPHFAGEPNFNVGFKHFDKILKTHKKTTFIGHADFFWANISSEIPTDTGYPPGPVKKGGLTDKWLGDYPNLYGDMSANSGHNALIRDEEFAAGFLKRHRAKLMFGSDCSCQDGHGKGGSPLLPQLKGRCVARATLEVAKKLAPVDVFRDITWDNANRLFKWS